MPLLAQTLKSLPIWLRRKFATVFGVATPNPVSLLQPTFVRGGSEMYRNAPLLQLRFLFQSNEWKTTEIKKGEHSLRSGRKTHKSCIRISAKQSVQEGWTRLSDDLLDCKPCILMTPVHMAAWFTAAGAQQSWNRSREAGRFRWEIFEGMVQQKDKGWMGSSVLRWGESGIIL